MPKKKTTIIAVFLISLILVCLMMTGCPQHNDSLYGAKVTGDGNGGAIAVYEATNGGNIYVQKISADGKTAWG
jgi:type IV secretory pathway TrbL component